VSGLLAVMILCFLAGLLFLLPLIPAIWEYRNKSDASPLTVVQQHTGEIRFFADGFRSYLKTLEPILRQSVRSGETTTGTMADGTEYMVFGRGDSALMLPFKDQAEGCQAMIAAGTDLMLPSEARFSKDIYTAGRLIGGTQNRYRAVLAEKDVHLGRGSTVMRWIHAAGSFIADPGCKLYGRVSSDRGIRLSTDCTFLRLNAPRIKTGEGEITAETSAVQPGNSVENRWNTTRTLQDGDLEIPAGEVVRGSLVVRGRLQIGAGARVCGSVKSEKEMVLQAGVRVEGSLISARQMRVGRDCLIHGPVIAEHTLRVEQGTHCGTSQTPTTVSAPNIEIEPDVVVFGTLWAREQGRVVSRT